MITLSFSTIQYCLQEDNSHNWLNKMAGLKVPDNEFFRNGHRLHSIIQAHLSGKTTDDRLKHINYSFSIVEEKDFDERCSFEFNINDKYSMRGFVDAKDPEALRLGEIKTAGKMWTVADFARSMQRKIYALAHPDYKELVGITALSDDKQWGTLPPKVYPIPLTQKDRDEAFAWIMKGIELLESGNFKGGLDENGKCTMRFCSYAENCQFK